MTPRERECLQAIKNLTVDGVSPSYEEIRARIGLKSKSGVCFLIDRLVEQGALRRSKHKARSLTVVEAPVDLQGFSDADLEALKRRIEAMQAERAAA